MTAELNDLPKLQYNGREEPLDEYPSTDDFSDYTYYEDEWDDLDYGILDTVVKDEEAETKKVEQIDFFADLLTQFREKRAQKQADKLEEQKGKLRELIGIKKERRESEETLITPEDASVSSTESSYESSLHHCLKAVDISDSQLKLQNLFASFPVPEDPGLSPAFWFIRDRQPSYSEDGREMYLDLSKTAGIGPIQSLMNMLTSDTVSLQYYGINQRAMRPLCEALMRNHYVHKLNLTGNWLSGDACYHLNELLLGNNAIHTVILSQCKIGPNGAAKLQNGILQSLTLTKLDLSDCDIGNEGLEFISYAVRNNENIETLLLNNNNLNESCSDELRKLLTDSKSLMYLKLSWNSLYTASAWRNLIKGLEYNTSLTDLDLSWNALGRECASLVGALVSLSSPLKILRLNGNRFTDNEVRAIVRGLSANKKLEELYLGNNPIRAPGALQLITAITPENANAPPLENALRLLDLTNVWAKREILPKLDILRQTMPWLDIKLGGILSNYEIQGPNVQALLLKRANYEARKTKKQRHRKNFGHFVISLPDGPISKVKFGEMVSKSRIKLSKSLLQEMTSAFQYTNKTIDLGLLKSVYLSLFPDIEPPPEKRSKKEKGTSKRLKATKKKKI